MIWLVSVDNDRWRQVASLIRKPFDHKCCWPSCHRHHCHHRRCLITIIIIVNLSEIWFMEEEELQVWMMRDLSAVGEEWAEAPEWLPHFVTDHTDRLHCCCWWCTDNTDNNWPHRHSLCCPCLDLNVFQACVFKMSSKLQGWNVTVWLTTSVWTCQTEWG